MSKRTNSESPPNGSGIFVVVLMIIIVLIAVIAIGVYLGNRIDEVTMNSILLLMERM